MHKRKIKPPTKSENDTDDLETVRITAHAFDFSMEDNPETDRAKMSIWAIGKDETRYLLRQENCPMFCYIGLPKYVDKKKYPWDNTSASYVFDYLKRALNYKDDHAPLQYLYCQNKEIYYYQGNKKSPYMLVYFKNQKSLSHCINLLKKPVEIKNIGTIELKIWESNISMVRKLLSLRKTKYAQWFEVEGKEVPIGHPERTAVSGKNNRIREILINWRTIDPIPLSQTKTWSSKPDVLAFDIETYSDNHKRMPNKLCASNVAYMIQAAFQTQGLKHTRKRFVILMGDCNEITVGEASEVIIKGVKHQLDPTVKIIRVDNEPDLVKAYADIILETDPDVITGYNIMGYDYDFLDTRLGIFYQENWPVMGRLIGKLPKMNKRAWSSSAYGQNTICNLEIDGRINIDLLPLVKRGHKFDRYTLDFVCKYFLKRGKHDVKAQQMFEAYEFMQAAKKLKEDFEEKLADTRKKLKEECDKTIKSLKEKWESLKSSLDNNEKDVMKKKLQTEINQLRRKNEEECENLEEEIYVEVDDEKLYKNNVNEIWDSALKHETKVVAYGVEDVELVIDLFEKLSVWIELVELSSIVGVTITELFTRGQQIRCQSQIYDLAVELGYVLTKRYAPKRFFNGGFVGDPVPGLYDNIICLDFNSLYPSIIIDSNMCYTTYVPPEYWDEVPVEDCNVVTFEQEEDPTFKSDSFDIEDDGFNGGDFSTRNEEQDAFGDTPAEVEPKKGKKKEEVKTIKKKYEMRFIKKEILPGIVPKLLSDLINERNNVKGQIKVLTKIFEQMEDLIEPLKDIIENKDVNILTEEEINTKKEKIFKQFEECTKKIFQENDIDFKYNKNALNYLDKLRELIEEIETQLTILDKRQAGLKVAANSMFGFFGAQNGLLPFIEIAMAVTGRGRVLINTVNEYMKSKYGADIVYNDTDSSFIDLHLKTRKECVEWGTRLEEEVSGKPAKKDKDGNIIEPAVPGLFGYILKVSFEKGCRGLFIKKKKYAYLPIHKNFEFARNADTKELIIEKKGIVPARRDNCVIIRKTYMKLLETILMQGTIDESYAIIIDTIVNLLKNNVKPRDELSITRALGAEYANDNYFMKVFADELQRVGKPMSASERAMYIVVKTKAELRGEEVKLGLKMRDIDMWEDSWTYYKGKSAMVDPKLDKDNIESLPVSFAKILNVKVSKDEKPTYPAENIDHLYYIEHLFMNPLDQLFSVGYNKLLQKYKGFSYKPQNSRAHECGVDTPIKMIGKIITDYIKGGGKVPSKEIITVISNLKQDFIDHRKIIDEAPNEDVVNEKNDIKEEKQGEEKKKDTRKIKLVIKKEEDEEEEVIKPKKNKIILKRTDEIAKSPDKILHSNKNLTVFKKDKDIQYVKYVNGEKLPKLE